MSVGEMVFDQKTQNKKVLENIFAQKMDAMTFSRVTAKKMAEILNRLLSQQKISCTLVLYLL